MRCIKCHHDDIRDGTSHCPKCGVYLPSALHDCLPKGTLLNRDEYQIDHVIGRGGFGITYCAVQKRLDRLVAIKEFFPRDLVLRHSSGEIVVASSQRERYKAGLQGFIKEGHLLALIKHPNVVQAIDLFDERGAAYLVMELLGKRTLRDEMETYAGGRLPVDRVRKIISDLASALSAAHKQNVWHLDIKPENVMLDKDGKISLVDFGAAKVDLVGPGGESGTRAFTLGYAAPELILKQEVGPQTDLFELGMLLHELLLGKLPPDAAERVGTGNEEIELEELENPWRMLLSSALRLNRKLRPVNIAEWWSQEARYREREERRRREAERRQHLAEIERIDLDLQRLIEENESLELKIGKLEQEQTALQERWREERVTLESEMENLIHESSVARKEAEQISLEKKRLESSFIALLGALMKRVASPLFSLWRLSVRLFTVLYDKYKGWKSRRTKSKDDSITLSAGDDHSILVNRSLAFRVLDVSLIIILNLVGVFLGYIALVYVVRFFSRIAGYFSRL